MVACAGLAGVFRSKHLERVPLELWVNWQAFGFVESSYDLTVDTPGYVVCAQTWVFDPGRDLGG
jgi:hypothetical protein